MGRMNGANTKSNIEVVSLEQYLELKNQGYEFDGYSYLFWEYVRLLHEIKPKYFLLENVRMPKRWEKVITKALGVNPIEINSNLVSAQERKRLYWTNIPVKQFPLKNIGIKDIVEPIEDKTDYDITDKVNKYLSAEYDDRKIQKNIKQKIRNYNSLGKSRCLGCYCGEYGNNTGLIVLHENGRYYSITPVEAERLQTIPDNYTNCISNPKRFHAIGNGWTVDVIAHIASFLPDEYKLDNELKE